MIFANVKKLIIPEGEVKQIASGSTILWKKGYTNLVPTSTTNTGAIFNGTGYQDGYRLSSSGGLSSATGGCVTGFIPCKSTDLIRMAGVSWFWNNNFCYLAFYDAAFSLLGSLNVYASSSTASGYISTVRGIVTHKKITQDGTTNSDNHPSESNGVYTFDQYGFNSTANAAKVAYFRINGYGSGANMIVTVNEEIDL